MSFGFGVGDVLAVSKLAHSIWKKFQDSSDQFRALRTEAANLYLVLGDVAQAVPRRELREKEVLTLSSLLHGCHEILTDTNKMLQKYETLGTSPSSSVARTQKAWRKIRWDQDEVDELRSRLTLSTVSLDAFNSSLASKTLQTVKDNLTDLTKRQDQQELQVIINWLSPLQFLSQQNDTISRRQKGTGQWLIQSDQFNTWLNTAQETLFCSGIPGAGKTMLAAIVIDHLCSTIRSVDVGIVHIYCNYKMQLEQTTVNLVASLLKQLVQQHGLISDDLKSLYCRHIKDETRPTLDEVFEMLQSEMNRYRQIFVVVDALDECSIENRVRQELLSKLYELQTSHNVNLMMTSRHLPDIMQEFQNSLQLEIRANEEDVRRYLDGQMFRLASCVRRNDNLQEAIKDSIVKAVDGMFLLAQLHLDSLKDKTNPKAIKNALENLPQGSDALSRAYDQAMKRIDDQEPGFRLLADQVLSWITHAQRPLTIVELQHALAIEEGEPGLDQENITDVKELVSVCLGLVVIDQETNIIRLVHYTTQEYFRQIRTQRFQNAQETIAAACLTYLSFDVFAKNCDLQYHERKVVESRLKQNPFLEYAANHWPDHAHGDAEKKVADRMITLLMDERKVLNCCQVLVCTSKFWYFAYYNNSKANEISGIHLIALFGLRDTMSLFLENEIEADSRDYHGRSPLILASQFGHEAIVELLLTRGAAVDSKQNTQRTALSYAAEEGHKPVVELLLTRGAAVDSKDYTNQTPLSYAVRWGHEAVVELLLTRGATMDLRYYTGQALLSCAAQRGHDAVVELLLTREVDIDSKDYQKQTSLSYAAEKGHELVVELLLTRGAEVDSKDETGQTPLSFAAKSGRKAVVELLLAHGAAVDSKDNNDQTPLSLSARSGREAVVELLLTRGAATDSDDYRGRTPLSYAAQRGYKDIVESLLTRGAAVDSDDYRGRTPLSYAAQEGHETVVELLLTRGAAVDSKVDIGEMPLSYAAQLGREDVVESLLTHAAAADSKIYIGRTPLSYVAQAGHEAVEELLLTRGAAVDSKDYMGRTPLSYAAQCGRKALAQLLLSRGAAVDSKDYKGRTPLSCAAQFGHRDIVQLLLTQGAAVDSKSDNDQTPLSNAVMNGHEAVAELLLTRGAAVDSKNENDQTPLSVAAMKGYEAVVKLLLERGVEADSKDRWGSTPLLVAAKHGQEAVVKLLMTRGADVNSKDDRNQTPLSCAVEGGHEHVVELLLAQGAALDSKDDIDQTPLIFAEPEGHEAVVKLLSLPSLR